MTEEIKQLTDHHKELMNYYRTVETTIEKQNNERGICACGDTGWIVKHLHEHTETYSRIIEYAIPCKCTCATMVKQKTERAGIPQEFEGLTLNNFDLDLYSPENRSIAEEALKKASIYVRNYGNMRKEIHKTKGLYIYSNTRGSGKTRLSASIANNLIRRENTSVIFKTSVDLLMDIRKCYDKESRDRESDVVDKFCTVNVLIIDDIGAEKSSKFVDEVFFRILDTRMKNYRTTIFTSNISRDSEKYEDRIADRLRKMAVEIKMPEESVRSKVGRKEEDDFFAMWN